jgi:hypothetical protein
MLYLLFFWARSGELLGAIRRTHVFTGGFTIASEVVVHFREPHAWL